MVLAGLVALPLSASAQEAEEGWLEEFYPELAPREPPPQQPSPSPERAPKEPAIEATTEQPAFELRLDDAGVEVAPGYPPRFDEMELRVKRARIGLVSSGISMFAGTVILLAAAGVGFCVGDPSACDPPALDPLLITGSVLAAGGFVAMIATGVELGKRKRKLHRLEYEYYRTRRPARWDLARSRLVF
jgi:hypothetical protein